jgi:hypothetical protein
VAVKATVVVGVMTVAIVVVVAVGMAVVVWHPPHNSVALSAVNATVVVGVVAVAVVVVAAVGMAMAVWYPPHNSDALPMPVLLPLSSLRGTARGSRHVHPQYEGLVLQKTGRIVGTLDTAAWTLWLGRPLSQCWVVSDTQPMPALLPLRTLCGTARGSRHLSLQYEGLVLQDTGRIVGTLDTPAWTLLWLGRQLAGSAP